ncbi:hypothetical protein ACKS0A_05067 [Histoplasma ohiense]
MCDLSLLRMMAKNGEGGRERERVFRGDLILPVPITPPPFCGRTERGKVFFFFFFFPLSVSPL